MRKVLIALVTISLLFISGCSQTNKDVAIEYLAEKGYDVDTYEGSGSMYQLTKEKIIDEFPIWALQTFEPGDYIGKEIETEYFRVDNHPLENWSNNGGVSANGNPLVSIIFVDGKPIGGYAIPNLDDDIDLLGYSTYDIDGKTLEEVHAIEDYPSWFDAWMEKYNEK
ncbi:hypothetical protein [Evansella cellulosilytica]|uniref:DUF4830 domain-containing protein n=1 Tax=Evansella cellulosilytica (strain ATCC 21833 / DSM 2522 / FERM P-1141 / JCM 9156 / N-4) TaxID=649639 RepID=E6TQY6_EVAC2|nr:hypothetical protein [Evansella cellulosilytica]ADU29362.1 hypothetical protein Bcell_1092 [Evansella cellulosilytica DSM 2522]